MTVFLLSVTQENRYKRFARPVPCRTILRAAASMDANINWNKVENAVEIQKYHDKDS